MARNFYYQYPVNWPRIIALLRLHEGLRLKAYLCTEKKLTIAIGHNLIANPIEGLGPDSKISYEYALAICTMDIMNVLDEITKHFAWAWNLDEVRFAVIVDMLFNMGLDRFSTFKKFLAAAERGAYENASLEMLDSKWAGQVKTRATRLAGMMFQGVWAA